MCGYLFFKSNIPIMNTEEKLIDSSELTQKNRGPDNFKKIKIIKDNLLMYFRRLSIIGIEEQSNQPMEIDNYIIMFNGEIYNYKFLKKEFLNNTNFFSSSDTEVVLRLYIKYGYNIFKYFSGIFSILIYNKINKETLVYRDPFGIKPLYYHLSNQKIIISSQSKTINKIIEKKIDSSSMKLYEFFGNLISKYTIYEDIYSFDPGKIYLINNSNIFKTITLENIYDQNYYNYSSKIDDVEDTLYSSIKENTVADVKVSLLYSSGYDSNIIAENLPDDNYNLFTISTKFNKGYQDEIPNSIALSKILKLNHKTYNYNLEEIGNLKNEFFDSMDQPTVDGLNTFLASNLIKKNNIKVALSGIGGDEYFGTYDTFKILPLFILFNKLIKNQNLNTFLKKIILRYFNKKKADLFIKTANTLENLYFCKRSNSSSIEDFSNFKKVLEDKNINHEINEIIKLDCPDRLKITLLELRFYCKDRLLRDVDWASMTNSIEIRVPFLNINFHKNICGYLANSKNKTILKSDLIKNSILKKKMKTIKKQGFYVPYINFDQKTTVNQSEYSKQVLEFFR